MVSSGQVISDMSSLSSVISNYSSYIGELNSCWQGSSHDILVSDANEFASNYLSTIESEMTSFAQACDLYSQYKNTKENLRITKLNYNRAVSAKDSGNASYFSAQITSCSNNLNSLKSQIESCLSAASSTKLEASPVSVSTAVTSAGGSNSTNARVQNAMDWAIAVAADNTHGYSQQTREGNPNYDCSSFVINAYEAAGVPVKEAGAGYTGNMKNSFTKVGFEWIPGNPSVESLQPGDVLLREASHTEMYIGNGLNVGAHGDSDGRNGDSSGNEISVTSYSGPWEGVLRYVGNESEV